MRSPRAGEQGWPLCCVMRLLRRKPTDSLNSRSLTGTETVRQAVRKFAPTPPETDKNRCSIKIELPFALVFARFFATWRTLFWSQSFVIGLVATFIFSFSYRDWSSHPSSIRAFSISIFRYRYQRDADADQPSTLSFDSRISRQCIQPLNQPRKR